MLAVPGETVAGPPDPWPLKIIIDNLLQGKRLPDRLAGIVERFAGDDTYAVLNFAVGAVAAVAIVGATCSYGQKRLTTSVGQWVMHDLPRCRWCPL